LQGIGTAGIIPATISHFCLQPLPGSLTIGILAHPFPPSRQCSIAFALFSARNLFGAGLGTTLGAIITQFSKLVFCPAGQHTWEAQLFSPNSVTWHGSFFVICSFGVLSFIIAAFTIDPDVPTMEKDACITLYIFLSFFLLPLIPNFFSHID
jgi:hypothetical protein